MYAGGSEYKLFQAVVVYRNNRYGKGDVALNLYDFVVRQPGKPTEKYGLRAYDEIILAPMVSLPSQIIPIILILSTNCR